MNVLHLTITEREKKKAQQKRNRNKSHNDKFNADAWEGKRGNYVGDRERVLLQSRVIF
jgi:hypothetical protein